VAICTLIVQNTVLRFGDTIPSQESTSISETPVLGKIIDSDEFHSLQGSTENSLRLALRLGSDPTLECNIISYRFHTGQSYIA
jgi:hypothetical protein